MTSEAMWVEYPSKVWKMPVYKKVNVRTSAVITVVIFEIKGVPLTPFLGHLRQIDDA